MRKAQKRSEADREMSEESRLPGRAVAGQPGDRVQVYLPDKSLRPGRDRRGSLSRWIDGTIREVDPPGLPRGVIVDLDEIVNGAGDCFATHAEVRPVPAPGGPQ